MCPLPTPKDYKTSILHHPTSGPTGRNVGNMHWSPSVALYWRTFFNPSSSPCIFTSLSTKRPSHVQPLLLYCDPMTWDLGWAVLQVEVMSGPNSLQQSWGPIEALEGGHGVHAQYVITTHSENGGKAYVSLDQIPNSTFILRSGSRLGSSSRTKRWVGGGGGILVQHRIHHTMNYYDFNVETQEQYWHHTCH